MIKIENFSHQYDQLKVVKNVSFETERGDIFGFIGPNGAGKTTTIRFLVTLLKSNMGRAFVNGINVVREPQKVRQCLGFMPDHFGVYDGMKVREYLDFFAMAYGIARNKRHRIVNDVIELVDLREKKEAMASRMSRGMRQRLGLARALLHDPPVLVLDEPASGLDPRGRIEIMELLRELQAMGKTILVSSHILTELANYCNKIGIMESGNLVACGELDEILTKMQTHKRIKLTVLKEASKTLALLKQFGGIIDLEQEQDTFYFDFEGDDEKLAQLISTAVEQKIPLLQIQEVPMNLEDVFMHLTKGELQ